ncbi:choice-of-anchor C domain-containing protein [Streptomyces sp. 1114.5]|uniref:choice-of-anchor C family protein n=1 Tax=unclassified Streptomyces TaxID=2593676 RepID=UPI000BCCB125|nr:MULTISPECIES: choice-of-anchor C family protein [unclassified Streptomyces]RKT18654.1 choice-of-anchor C domain-containing protein [Streptomyces sp. 1114.5]SOB84855.1 choice-of-anchor C domain-containing protein [Streptomyces sp. 1331.2]
MQLSRTRVAVVALIAAATTALAVPAQAAGGHRALSRFDDGSFETPKAPANAFTEFNAGQVIGPWKVVSGSVDLIGAGFWQAAEGDQSLDLNGGNSGTVSQAFTTVPGTTYSVTYALAGNPGGGPALRTGRVTIDGQSFQDFTFDVTGKTMAAMGYVGRQFTFVAQNSSTTLGFVSTVAGAYGPVIDNVQVTACKPCCG